LRTGVALQIGSTTTNGSDKQKALERKQIVVGALKEANVSDRAEDARSPHV
jgi:hypothetical protein